jgi:hypothetical protein
VSPVPTIVNGIVILKKLTITSISFILLEEYNNDVSSANSLDKL